MAYTKTKLAIAAIIVTIGVAVAIYFAVRKKSGGESPPAPADFKTCDTVPASATPNAQMPRGTYTSISYYNCVVAQAEGEGATLDEESYVGEQTPPPGLQMACTMATFTFNFTPGPFNCAGKRVGKGSCEVLIENEYLGVSGKYVKNDVEYYIDGQNRMYFQGNWDAFASNVFGTTPPTVGYNSDTDTITVNSSMLCNPVQFIISSEPVCIPIAQNVQLVLMPSVSNPLAPASVVAAPK